MDIGLYCEIDIICIVVSAIILIHSKVSMSGTEENKLFNLMVLFNILLFLSDLGWMIVDGNPSLPHWINFLFNAVYFFLTAFNTLLWFVYVDRMYGRKFTGKKRNLFLCALPVFVFLVFIFLSVGNGCLFYIDENNVYHRGVLYPMQVVVGYSYIGISFVRSLLRALDKKYFVERSKNILLASYGVFPFIASLIQVIVPGTALACVGIMLSIFIVSYGFLDEMVSIDPLTQLNNRNQMLRFLSSKMKHEGNGLYIFMADIDAFKAINDTYGHVEGDAALKRVSAALKRLCEDNGFFVARYGGDEFILIGEGVDERYAERFAVVVNEGVKSVCEEDKIPYSIVLSVGYAMYDKDVTDMRGFIDRADENLYLEKAKKKAAKAAA